MQAGVVRVVVACRDAFHKVAGRGVNILAAAGITVVSGLREDNAAALYAGFFHRLATGLPLIEVDGRAGLYDAELTATSPEDAQSQVEAFGEAGMNRVRLAPGHPLEGHAWRPLPDN